MMKKTAKILLYGVGFLFMIFVVGIVWQVATVGGVAPDPKFLEKAISKSALTHANIPNDTMRSIIWQYQYQRMPNGQSVFVCQMTMFYDRKTGADKIITYQMKIEPSDDFWGERWRLLEIKTIDIADKQ